MSFCDLKHAKDKILEGIRGTTFSTVVPEFNKDQKLSLCPHTVLAATVPIFFIKDLRSAAFSALSVHSPLSLKYCNCWTAIMLVIVTSLPLTYQTQERRAVSYEVCEQPW